MKIGGDTAEYGLLHLLIGYLDAPEERVRADDSAEDYEREINRTLLVEIERKRNTFEDGMRFIKNRQR